MNGWSPNRRRDWRGIRPGEARPAEARPAEPPPPGSSRADSEHLYREMFEHAAWGLFQTTVDGQYLTANRALARIYGYESPAELLSAMTDIGRQLYVDSSRRDDFIRQMREHAALSGFEAQIYRRDGAVIWISESCREVRDREGRLLYYEGTVEEITARKAAEAELRAAKDEAEAANRAKSAFLALMSHELRTPLNAVLGFSQLMLDQVLGPLPNGYRDYLGHIHDSGARLLAIVNNVLDLAEVESGRLELQCDIVPLGRLARACLAEVETEARAKQIELRLRQPAEPATLDADPRRVRKALLSLLSNALKFTGTGGAVIVVIAHLPDGGISLSVEDSGIGMSEHDLSHAIEPFRQVEGVLARRYDGMGLGLPIAKALVELHGGRLVLGSVPGRGTRAALEFPAAPVLRPVG